MNITTFAIAASFVLLILVVLQTWYHEREMTKLSDLLDEQRDDARFDAAVIRDLRNQHIANQHTINQLHTYYSLRAQHPEPSTDQLPCIKGDSYELPFNVTELRSS